MKLELQLFGGRGGSSGLSGGSGVESEPTTTAEKYMRKLTDDQKYRLEEHKRDLERFYADVTKTKGTLAEDPTEKVVMVQSGQFIGARGKKITSYFRYDKPDLGQYTMDRKRRFYLETWD